MKSKILEKHGNFFDHGPPPVPVIECIAEADRGSSYEVDAGAIFKVKGRGYIGVVISGCS